MLGKFEQGIEMLVLTQSFAIDFNLERRFGESIAEQGDRSRGVILPGSPEKALGGRRGMKPRCPLAHPRISGDWSVNEIRTMEAQSLESLRRKIDCPQTMLRPNAGDDEILLT